MGIKTYDRYKETNTEWIGNIPVHWDTKKIKYLGKGRLRKKKMENLRLITKKFSLVKKRFKIQFHYRNCLMFNFF